MSSENIGKAVRRGAALASGVQIFAMALDIVIMMVMARLLTPADFGIFAAAVLFIAVCDLFREIGVSTTLVQMSSITDIDKRTAFTIVLATSLLVFTLTQIFASTIAQFFALPELEATLRVLAGVVIFQSIGMVPQGLLLRDLRVVQLSLVEVAAKSAANLVVGIGLALAGFGYWALIAAAFTEALLRSGALVVVSKQRPQLGFERESARRLMSKSSGFAFSRVMTFISLRTDHAMVAKFMDAASLGMYSRAHKIMSLPGDLYTKVADRSLFPAMAKVQLNPERLKSAYLKSVELTALFGIPLVLAIYLLAPEIILIVLGAQWVEVTPIFAVLSFAMYFKLLAKVSGSLLRAVAAIRHLVVTQTFYAASMIGACLWAAQQSLEHVAWTTVIVVSAWFTLMTTLACKVVGVSMLEFFSVQRFGMILGAIMVALILTVRQIAGLSGSSAGMMMLYLAGAMAVVGLILARLRPHPVLGRQGVEALAHLEESIHAFRARFK